MSVRLPTATVAAIREHRYADGLTSEQTAEILGLADTTVRRYAPGRPGKVDNARLRAAFEASGLTTHQVAVRLRWFLDGRPDSRRVKRTIGLVAERSRGQLRHRRLIDAETARHIAEAIGVCPWTIGYGDRLEDQLR